jgi:3-phosphoshikimate 1-carboxyvinyltransferase
MDVTVPGDMSSAAFFFATAAGLGGRVEAPGLGVNPARIGFLETLMDAGATVSIDQRRTSGGEPVADVTVEAGVLRPVIVETSAHVARMIDELPLVAVLATRADGTTVVRGAGELRHKESDRIDAIVRNLRAMGAAIEALDDGFAVRGPCALRGARVDAFGDHRIAMAMAVAGLFAEGETTIDGAGSVRISWPGFFGEMRRLAGEEAIT